MRLNAYQVLKYDYFHVQILNMNFIKQAYLLEQVNKLKGKKYELAIITPLLFDADLLIIKPFAQYYIRPNDDHFFIDLYYPDLGIAIEIDEEHHKRQIDQDAVRERDILDCINCDFERIKVEADTDCIKERERIKRLILSKVDTLMQANSFKEWNPSSFELVKAQRDHPNTIFYKIKENNDLPPNPFRQPINIAFEKTQKADLFVGISGGTVVDVFNVRPTDWEKVGQGYRQHGVSDPAHPLISSGTTDWKISSNKAFGDNLKD